MVQFVCPLIFVHSGIFPATDPYGLLEPTSGFVGFLANDTGFVPPDYVVVTGGVLIRDCRFVGVGGR